MTFLNDLNSQQREAAKALDGPALIVAGAGSGKTRVLTYRIAHLLSIGVPAYHILSLTFTNKAAREMKERILKLAGEQSNALWMGTFHSIFARILRYESDKIPGYNRNFTIYDDGDSVSLVKRIMATMGISTQQFNANSIRSVISNSKNQMIAPEEFAKKTMSAFEERTSSVFAAYEQQLRESNAMDFDDLLLKPIGLFQNNSDVLEKYQEKFRFILVDEYQDTNRVQYTLLKTLASKRKNICVVGDDAQSIYSFRGADIRNILDFERDYPEAKIFRLEQNYRSTKNILGAADRLIKVNDDQIKKTLWTENESGEVVHTIECIDDRDEGAQIIDRISKDCHRFQLDLKNVAILYRTNAQSRSLEDSLRRNSIPYIIVGGVAFYQRKEIKDVIAYLRVLVNPQDTESLLRIINYPNRAIGDVALNHLKDFAVQNNISFLESVHRAAENPRLSPKSKSGMKQLSNLFTKYGNLRSQISLTELTRAFIEETGILFLLKEEATPESMDRWQNVQELLSAISEYVDEHPEATLEQYLEEVALISEIDQLKDQHNRVTLMTLHSAKGLEFPLVFVTGLEEGLLPFYSTSVDVKDLEEERRLLYVGMTRAMKKLYLTHARTRFRFGEVLYQSPSRFLTEIRGNGVEEFHSFKKIAPKSFETRNVIRKPAVKKEETYFNDEMPDYEGGMSETKRLRVGGIVKHESFGRGKILSISGSGDMMKAVVTFETGERKSLMVKYAKLTMI